MGWPTPQDYNEAIQNPHINFRDPDLKAGQPELTILGLPKPITGGFASVYRVQSGSHDWAVRCFLSECRDQRNRYDMISRYLGQTHIPYVVGFTFLDQGIKVGSRWHPVLKMEWVHGVSLNDFIGKHLHDPIALSKLAQRWVQMVASLGRAGIAHGDLQHG